MTSEDDRRESSEESSGESEASSGGRSLDASGDDGNRERSEPRDSENRPERDSQETRTESEATREGSEDDAKEPRTDGAGAGDIPLNIAGHDDEKKRREGGDMEPETNGADPSENEDESVLSEFDVSEPGESDEEVEPVELLVQLAEDGEIDPWDIDVVTVTDKFLDRLDEADLRTGGRALFYASVLLRMKSDAMWNDEEEDEREEEPWEMPPEEREGGPAVDPFEKLEAEMDRRIERKRARGMPETLDELVRDLRERERDTWWKESRTYDTDESPSGFSRGTQTLDYRSGDDFRMDDEPTADDVTGTAHDEHMEDIINDVYVELQSHYDQGRDEVLFAEIRTAGGSRVNTFLGLLFLAHRGQIQLQQDDLFGDLWIQDPAAAVGEETAAADD
ncbi:MAG: segregation and condensation protein A [Natronomonas sp.]|jgi:segregation and condensation protein A|uniref:segregation/condensation protein A n=1 Tax=Natronomonas sp. TaxID=2184060 RepID=UPI003988E7BE